MAQKVYSRNLKREKLYQIDHIPDHQKQQRSPASKRKRADFSLFSSSSDDNKGEGNESPELLKLQCQSSSEERLRPLSDFYGMQAVEVESSGRNGVNCSNSEQGSEVAVSEFENCFEGRSGNSTEDFQNALKQELKRKDDPSSPAKLIPAPDGSIHSEDQTYDKHAASISSMTEADFPKPRRGTRERKRNSRFDKVTFQQNPARKVRRFKIMRNLGLIPPVGSPF